jgi:hypothetical protein
MREEIIGSKRKITQDGVSRFVLIREECVGHQKEDAERNTLDEERANAKPEPNRALERHIRRLEGKS